MSFDHDVYPYAVLRFVCNKKSVSVFENVELSEGQTGTNLLNSTRILTTSNIFSRKTEVPAFLPAPVNSESCTPHQSPKSERLQSRVLNICDMYVLLNAIGASDLPSAESLVFLDVSITVLNICVTPLNYDLPGTLDLISRVT